MSKLSFAEFHHISSHNLPKRLAEQLPKSSPASGATDLHLVAAMDLAAMPSQLQALSKSPAIDWFYPKSSSQHFEGFLRSDVFAALHIKKSGAVGSTGLKLVGVKHFDADFTVLELRRAPQTTSPDYDQLVPTVLAKLKQKAPQLAPKFAKLAPADQIQWARFIFSAKRPVTQNSHFEQMVLVLASGFPTLAAYQAAQ